MDTGVEKRMMEDGNFHPEEQNPDPEDIKHESGLDEEQAPLDPAKSDNGNDLAHDEQTAEEKSEMGKLRERLEENQHRAQEYLEGWQRSRAEFANYKKRILRERELLHDEVKGRVIKDYLDILDDLERALKERPEGEEGSTWAEGIELIYKKLHDKLDAEGVRPMRAEGVQLPPNLHEAIMTEESDEFESGQVIDVIERGYWIGDRILRPARVRVAA